MELDRILERLADIGKGVALGTDVNVLNRTRRAYAAIRNGFPPKPAVESIGLPKPEAAALLQFILENTPPPPVMPANHEMQAFIESCTPSDSELAENRYWQEVLDKSW